ncbi:MAG: PAS domain S-box protein [Bacteroidales bacterium]|nr:PAS domain S-box protein [Bacteroidales bacterium]
MTDETPSQLKKRIAGLEQRIEQLEQSNFLYKNIVDNLPLGIQVFDSDGYSFKINRKQKDLLGLSDMDEGIGEFNVLTDPYSKAMGADKKYEQVYNGSTYENEFEYNPGIEDNQWNTREASLIIHERIFPVKDREGNVNYTVAVLEDKTEERRAERSCRESEEKYRITLNSIGDAVISTDTEGKILQMNEVARNMTGWSEEEAIGQPMEEVFHIVNTHTGEITENPLDEVLRSGKIVDLAKDTKLISKNGTEYQIADSASPIKDDDGNIHGVVIVFRNITERKRHESERRITLQLLQHMHTTNDLHELMSGITELMKEWSGCEAVGIRLKQGEDFPYYETRGFPDEFVHLENSLCEVDEQGEYVRDSRGSPVLECMCGNVIRGRTDASQPFFTEFGSFWTNSTTDLLGSTSEEDLQARTRNRCQGEGYESVALIPLRHGNNTLGLLQFNEPKRNCFDEEQIHLFERLASNLALAVSQHHTAEELQKSEEKFRALFENAPVGIFQTTSKGKLLMINDTMAHILDFDNSEEALAYYGDLSQQLYLYPERREKFLQLLNEEGKVEDFEYAAKTCKGRQIWLTMNARIANTYPDGSLLIEGFVADITARKLAEQGLAKSNNKFKALVQQSSEMLFLHDLDGRIVEFNRAAKKNTGYGQKELASMTVFDIDPDAIDRDDQKKYWQALSVNDEPVYFEVRHRKKDGSIYPAEVIISKVVLEDQEYILALARDITERKKAEKELKKTEARQSAMIANIADVLAIMDKKGIIQYKSPNITRLFGWKPEELIGSSCWETVHPDDRERLQDQFNQLLQRKNDTTKVEYSYRCKDNTYTPVELTAVNLLHDPNVKGILVNYHDVSRQKMVEEELRNAKEKAEESDRLKSAFLANMSHEIRTPMNGIMGFSQMLREKEYPRDKQKQYLDIIYSRTLHLLQIINDLVDVSKIEAGQLTLNFQEFCLNDLLQQLYNIYKKELESREKPHIQLLMDVALDNEHGVIKSDVNRFRQIMDNLLSNAIKYTHKGRIAFGYELQPSPYLLFYVADTGIGIPSEKQGIIFERFRRVEDSTRRVYEGTGLGLTISKNLVELMGGEMWVESRENEGTVIYFTLPYQQSEAGKKEEKQNLKKERYDLTDKTLLIIEDDPTSREYLNEVLNTLGAGVIFAENGAEGLQAFEKKPSIDLILLDIRLPDINGIEIARRIREQNEKVPVIAQTANAMGGDRGKCIQAGATDYIAKPTDMEELLAMIIKYI